MCCIKFLSYTALFRVSICGPPGNVNWELCISGLPLKVYRMYNKCERNLHFIDKVVKNTCMYFGICIAVNTAMLHVAACLYNRAS